MSELHSSILQRHNTVNFTVCVQETDLHAFVREFEKEMAFSSGSIDRYYADGSGWVLSLTISGAELQSEKRFHEFLESFFKGRP
jgi:hypothetical protein